MERFTSPVALVSGWTGKSFCSLQADAWILAAFSSAQLPACSSTSLGGKRNKILFFLNTTPRLHLRTKQPSRNVVDIAVQNNPLKLIQGTGSLRSHFKMFPNKTGRAGVDLDQKFHRRGKKIFLDRKASGFFFFLNEKLKTTHTGKQS